MLRHFPRRTSLRRTLVVLSSLLSLAGLWSCLKTEVSPSEYTLALHAGPAVVTQIRTAWMERLLLPLANVVVADEHDSRQKQIPDLGPLENHRYRSDGLLEVNPNGPHPIFELIRNAEAEWEAKLSRSSRTLAAAVAEYKRRYKRLPPQGFDAWWRYVQKHNVQLPDEYDQIYEDLEPFWGMDPADLQRIESRSEGYSDSYTVGKTAGSRISLVNTSLPGNENSNYDLALGAYDIMDILAEVEDVIPPFRAVFSPHDNPYQSTDWELREQAVKHAAAGTLLDLDDPPPVKLNGWIASCDPTSPAAQALIDWDGPAQLQTTKTFIHSHKLAMDPCRHPELFLLHGQFLSYNKGPIPDRFMTPHFSYSPTLLHYDITVAMPINWVADLPEGANPEWEEKIDERLQWRGSNTGMWHAKTTRWRDSQRVRAIVWAQVNGRENVTVLRESREDRRVGQGQKVNWARWAPAMLDVAFARGPVSCAPETCDDLKDMFEFREAQDVKYAGRYKYVLDLDGNGWSSRFKRLITSNSLIFKSTIYPEWFTDRIAPWVHYIPVQGDLSDLADILVFFRGDPNGEGVHDDLAKKIAMAGREWSLKFWRKEDMTAYMFRLFLEYARVMSSDRLEMNYTHGKSSVSEPEERLVDSDDQASDSGEHDDREIWVPSDSEEENFEDAEGADSNGNWEVEIIGDEVAMGGWGRKPDIRYEARWKGWQRKDGTNVTWNNSLLHEDDIQSYNKKQAIRRKKLAEESLEIKMDIFTNTDIHLIATEYRRNAIEEKLKRHASLPKVDMEKLTNENLAFAADSEEEEEPSPAKNSRPPQSRSKSPSQSQPYGSHTPAPSSSTRASSRASSTVVGTSVPASVNRTLTRSLTASSSEFFPSSESTPPLSAKALGKQRASSPASYSPSMKNRKRALSPSSTLVEEDRKTQHEIKSRRTSQPSGFTMRKALEREWSAVARKARAVAIKIVNDIDDEEIPPLPGGFRYIESKYLYSKSVPRIEDDDNGLFLRCDCTAALQCTGECSCQAFSELSINGEKVLAYTQDRLYNAFDAPREYEVIECNKYCSCDPLKCPNRVVQQPRDVPIEVFKTADRGWGVRSSIHIKKGKVLGIYTGLLITRQASLALREDQRAYIFDLDNRERADFEEENLNTYSVDSMKNGNWTRFLNHSCDPNLIIYMAVYDTIAELNMPYIAFAASMDIPARTEFTFDYDPAATREEQERKKKSKTKTKKKKGNRRVIPEGRKPCTCGAGDLCRGFV